jgi:ribosomal-protein-alanine N-acetyltransferase
MKKGLAHIETARLWLRPCTPGDIDRLHQIWTEPGVRKYLWDDEIISRQQTIAIVEGSLEQFAAQGDGIWVMGLHDEVTVIGFCGFWFFHEPPQLELLYGLTTTSWNKGLTTEAARAMMRYGFEERDFSTILASTDAPNTASIRVMEKTGMTFQKREEAEGLDTIFYTVDRKAFGWGEEEYHVTYRSEA